MTFMLQLVIGYVQELPAKRLQLRLKFHLAKGILQQPQAAGRVTSKFCTAPSAYIRLFCLTRKYCQLAGAVRRLRIHSRQLEHMQMPSVLVAKMDRKEDE
jgi:hypothetical protein